MLLTNMLYFIELGSVVRLFNEELEKISRLREELRQNKDKMKDKF